MDTNRSQSDFAEILGYVKSCENKAQQLAWQRGIVMRQFDDLEDEIAAMDVVGAAAPTMDGLMKAADAVSGGHVTRRGRRGF